MRAVAETSFPVVLGGDQYLTYPSFCGVAEARDERLGLIHLDSHSDVYGSCDLHGDHWHGSPMNLINDTEHDGYETHSMVGLRAREAPDFPVFVEEKGLHVSYARGVHDRGLQAVSQTPSTMPHNMSTLSISRSISMLSYRPLRQGLERRNSAVST